MPFDFDGWDLNVNATEVNLSDSDITDDDLILIVERLKEMPNLVTLNLEGNQITSIEGLSGLDGLTGLRLHGNQITSIEGLSGLVGLTDLRLDDGVADPHRIVQRNKLNNFHSNIFRLNRLAKFEILSG